MLTDVADSATDSTSVKVPELLIPTASTHLPQVERKLTSWSECHNLGIVTLQPALLQGFWLQPLPHEHHMDLSCRLLAHQAIDVRLRHLTPLHHLPKAGTLSVVAAESAVSKCTMLRKKLHKSVDQN